MVEVHRDAGVGVLRHEPHHGGKFAEAVQAEAVHVFRQQHGDGGLAGALRGVDDGSDFIVIDAYEGKDGGILLARLANEVDGADQTHGVSLL